LYIVQRRRSESGVIAVCFLRLAAHSKFRGRDENRRGDRYQIGASQATLSTAVLYNNVTGFLELAERIHEYLQFKRELTFTKLARTAPCSVSREAE